MERFCFILGMLKFLGGSNVFAEVGVGDWHSSSMLHPLTDILLSSAGIFLPASEKMPLVVPFCWISNADIGSTCVKAIILPPPSDHCLHLPATTK